MCSRRPHDKLDVNPCAPGNHIIALMWTHVLQKGPQNITHQSPNKQHRPYYRFDVNPCAIVWSSGAHGFTSSLWCGLLEHMGSHQGYNVVFWSTWVHIRSIMWSSGAHGFTSNLWCGLLEHMGSHQVYYVVFWITWAWCEPMCSRRPHYRLGVKSCAPEDHIIDLMWTHVLQKTTL
jgi:hypothetical protein